MTLEPYHPDRLDQLALQFLDLAAAARSMAASCREHGITSLDLHDRKPQEWLEKLREWSDRARAELDVRLIRERALQATAKPSVRARPPRAAAAGKPEVATKRSK